MSYYSDVAKERLKEVRSAEYEIQHCLQRIEALDNVAQCCGSFACEDKVQSSSGKSKMEDAIIKLLDAKDELAERVVYWQELQEEVSREMLCLNPTERRILWSRYVLGETDRKIARSVNYSESHTRLLRNGGLEKLGEKIEKHLT